VLEKDKSFLENEKGLLEEEVQRCSRTETEMASRFDHAQREKFEIKSKLDDVKKVFFHLLFENVRKCGAYMLKFSTKGAFRDMNR